MLRGLAPALVLALAVPAHGQSSFEFGSAGPGPEPHPRAAEIFADVQGYADLSTDRHGTVAQPVSHELGLILILRMFRNVCLGLERGAPLDDVMPPGFAAYAQSPYLFGEIQPATDGPQVLSPTGSIDADEDNGHPTIWLSPGETRMNCRLEWRAAAAFPEDRQTGMALFLDDWLPYTLSLVRASRPALVSPPSPFDATEWDRPCGDRWCPVTVIFDLPDGFVSLETRLNITDIESVRP